MAIKKLPLNIYNRPLMTFVNNHQELDLEAPYQRGLVWGEDRKRSLIESVLDGTPIPALILNDRFSAKFKAEGYDRDRLWAFAVIDGKQRVTALRDFTEDKFTVPAEWFEEEDIVEEAKGKENIVYSDLTRAFHRGFTMNTIPVAEGRFDSLEGEKQVFDRVNFGGVAQGDSDF